MFHKCENKKQAEELYIELSTKLNPDNGGSEKLMRLLNDAYGAFLDNLSSENDCNMTLGEKEIKKVTWKSKFMEYNDKYLEVWELGLPFKIYGIIFLISIYFFFVGIFKIINWFNGI